MPIYLYWFLAFQLILVSLIDIKYKKISNTWFFINILLFCTFLWVFPDQYSLNLMAFKYSIGFLVVGIALFALKVMGAGDSKFLASFFLLIPQNLQFDYFLYLIYVTIFVSSLLFLMNILKNFDRMKKAVVFLQPSGIKDLMGKKFTYAPIILVAWLGMGWVKIF